MCRLVVTSSMSNITLGVPQGSILGPWLFNIYINDLHKSLHTCKCILYADDTTIFLSGGDYEEIRLKMNNDLKSASKWFNCNKLSLNTRKSCFIVFHTRQRILNNVNLNLSIGIEPLTRAHHTKFLGLIMDEHLSWRYHVDSVRLAVIKSLYLLNRVKHLFSAKFLRMLYFALVHPHINYGLLLWGFSSVTHLNGIFKLQKRALRVVGDVSFRAHTGELFKKYAILNIEDLRTFNLLIFMYDVMSKRAPPRTVQIFSNKKNVHGHNTRQGDLYVQQRTLSLSTNSFLHRGPLAWLALDTSLKDCCNNHVFRMQLKRLLLN